MSWLNVKKLLPARMVWKLLKNKLPLKLHKLSRSKANKKKPKNISCKTSKKLRWKFKNNNNSNSLIHHRHRNHNFHKRPPPVFVEQLFVEPVSVVKERVLTPGVAVKESACKEKPCWIIGNMKKDEISYERSTDCHNMISADYMWESMVMGSPQMHGINERAEVFITRIKAEMRHQEMLARCF